MNPRSSKDPNRALKIAMIVMLMIPAAVALAAGTMTAMEDLHKGLPMVAAGVILAVFNFMILKFYFKRLAAQKSPK